MLENISDIIGCLCLTSIGLVFGYLLSNEKFTKKKIAITIIIIIAYSMQAAKEFITSARKNYSRINLRLLSS